ncbi:MAG: type I-E CRISPR-associated protein Cas6/Cse3/CasE, partial [Promethearchaeota archaeon]
MLKTSDAENKLYLSRLILNIRNKKVAQDLGNCYSMHKRVMSGFPDIKNTHKNGNEKITARQKFNVLYRPEISKTKNSIVLIVQSTIKPDWSKLPKNYVTNNEFFNAGIQVKDISKILDIIENGMKLRFRLRANPTKKIPTKDENGNIIKSKKNNSRVPLIRDKDQLDWLKRKAEKCGFEPLKITYHRVKAENGLRT